MPFMAGVRVMILLLYWCILLYAFHGWCQGYDIAVILVHSFICLSWLWCFLLSAFHGWCQGYSIAEQRTRQHLSHICELFLN